MNSEALLACSTFPDPETARKIARQLVSENLAACANIVPAVESIYLWQHKVEDALETLVFFKTTTASYPKLQERLSSLHPYEVPEIICLSIVQGLPAYLRWIEESTHGLER